MNEKYVWEFTNQKKLTKSEFLNYFERKVFRTIRKFEMLGKNKKILLKKSSDINTAVLKRILEKKFEVKFSEKPNFSSENLSDVSEKIFQNILSGKFSGPKPEDKISRPLYFLSDEEIKIYATLVGISEKKRKEDKRIQELFQKFKIKNPDLEQNIVNAIEKIN